MANSLSLAHIFSVGSLSQSMSQNVESLISEIMSDGLIMEVSSVNELSW